MNSRVSATFFYILRHLFFPLSLSHSPSLFFSMTPLSLTQLECSLATLSGTFHAINLYKSKEQRGITRTKNTWKFEMMWVMDVVGWIMIETTHAPETEPLVSFVWRASCVCLLMWNQTPEDITNTHTHTHEYIHINLMHIHNWRWIRIHFNLYCDLFFFLLLNPSLVSFYLVMNHLHLCNRLKESTGVTFFRA